MTTTMIPRRATLPRYLALLQVQLKTSALLAMQYRFDFLIHGVMAIFWLGVTLIPLIAVFDQREQVAGWTYPESLIVIGWFACLKGVLEGGVQPSLTAVVEGVRDGRFDFTLMKPADAQFLVSTARFEPWRLIDVLGGVAIFVYAFQKIGHGPSGVAIVGAVIFFAMAVLLLYSLWILVISASFWVVRVDNLGYLLSSIFDAARWPVSVFPGALRILFLVVFPLALMTTYPALVLLGKISLGTAILCLAGGLAFFTVARLVWLQAIKTYTSASS